MSGFRRLIAIGALVVVSGCATFESPDGGFAGGGYVVAGEPQAAEAGAAILARGGSAADAVTATYLALSVTYPVAAGLGGGGLCIVHTRQKDTTLDFEPREAGRGGLYAVPGNLSGFSRLQAIYGRLPWQRVVSPAESLADAGFRISPALAARLADSIGIVRLDAALSAEFLDESGAIKPVGSRVGAPALAQTLSDIRTQGAEVLYRGRLADRIVTYASAQGGAITAADLKTYTSTRSPSAETRIGQAEVYLPSAATPAGRYASAVLSHVVGAQGDVEARGGALAQLVFSAAKAGYNADSAAPIPPDLGATGFAAVDGEGMAVACGVTMNGPFGSGHTVTATGITLANAPNIGRFGISDMFLTPTIALADDGDALLAGTGTGGPAGSAAILLELLRFASGENITRPGALQATGREPSQTVNVIGCHGGICVADADPRGSGFGAAGK